MALTVAQIMDARCPGVDTTSERVLSLVELAGYQTNSSAFGDHYNHAIALLTLHWLSMSDSSRMETGGGAVTALKEGQLSINYGTGFASKETALASTTYGQEYLELRSMSSMFADVRGSGDIPKTEMDYPY